MSKWFIEHPTGLRFLALRSDNDPPSRLMHWVDDMDLAIQLARKRDAEDLIGFLAPQFGLGLSGAKVHYTV